MSTAELLKRSGIKSGSGSGSSSGSSSNTNSHVNTARSAASSSSSSSDTLQLGPLGGKTKNSMNSTNSSSFSGKVPSEGSSSSSTDSAVESLNAQVEDMGLSAEALEVLISEPDNLITFMENKSNRAGGTGQGNNTIASTVKTKTGFATVRPTELPGRLDSKSRIQILKRDGPENYKINQQIRSC
jgi:hypothetical protein